MTTLNDIATRLNVSTGLVSGVLNGKSGVRTRQETRQRILDLAREMDYRPSAAARALVTGKTRQMAVVIGEAALLDADPGKMCELRGIMAAAHEHDYRVLVVPLNNADHTAIENLASSRMCDGFCVPAQQWSAGLSNYLTGRNVPFVVMGDTGDGVAPLVDHDNYQQYFDSVTWLAAQGHRRIGLSATDVTAGSVRPPFHHRIFAGYNDAMKEHVALVSTVRRDLQFTGDPTDEAIAVWVQAMRPTAVIVYGVWRVMQWKRVLESMPKPTSHDVLIMGHIDVSEFHHLAFDSFQGLALNLFDSTAVGHRAARVLLDGIEGRTTDEPVLMPSNGPRWWNEIHGTQ